MVLRPVLRAKWLYYPILCVVCWGIWVLGSKLGSNEIPASSMQFLFAFGFIPVAFLVLILKPVKFEKSIKGILYSLGNGVLAGIGGLALFAAYRTEGNTSVITAATALYPQAPWLATDMVLKSSPIPSSGISNCIWSLTAAPNPIVACICGAATRCRSKPTPCRNLPVIIRAGCTDSWRPRRSCRANPENGGPSTSPFWDEPLPLCRTAKPLSIARKSRELQEARSTATKSCLGPSTFRAARRDGWPSGTLLLRPRRNDSGTIGI